MFFLLPYGSDRQNSQFPAMTYALIAGNVIVYLCLLPLGQEAVVSQFGLSPSHASVMYILTSMFVHATPSHLIWNMLFLWLFGPNIEDVLGRVRYVILYLASGFMAAIMHSFITTMFIPAYSDIPLVGASGAIAGLLGFFLVRFYWTEIKIFWCIPFRCGTFTISALFGLGVWFLQQFVGGLLCVMGQTYDDAPNLFFQVAHVILPEEVGYWSHIGGIIFGVTVSYALGMLFQGTKEHRMADAQKSLDQGTTWHAAEHYCAILECEPDNAEVHAHLARTYALQQDADLAVAHYQKCIELFLNEKDHDKVISAFVELRSFYRYARVGLQSEFQIARQMGEMGRYELALQLYKEIIVEYPDAPEAEVSYMKAGDIYLHKLNNPKEAASFYQRFLKEYTSSSWRMLVIRSLAEAQHKARINLPS